MGSCEGDESDDHPSHCIVERVAFVGGEFHQRGGETGRQIFSTKD